MIKIINVCKTYHKRSSKTKALNGVSLTFGVSGFVCLFGRSGSGKSTLINILGGVDLPSDGTIEFEGARIDKSNVDSYRTNNVGFVFQEHNLIPKYTIKDNLKIAFAISNKTYSDEDVKSYLSTVMLPDDGSDLDSFLKKTPSELSGGQKQRVAIVRAMIKGARVLLLDEPTSALDEHNSRLLMELLKKISQNTLVIMATHNVSMAKEYVDRFIEIDKGEIVNDDSSVEVCGQNIPLSEGRRRSHLKFGIFFESAVKMLKGNFARLFTSMALLLLTVSSFGTVLSIQTTNVEESLMRTQLEQSDKKLFFVESNFKISSVFHGVEEGQVAFSENQKMKLKEFSGESNPVYITHLDNSLMSYTRSTEMDPFYNMATFNSDYAMEVKEDSGLFDTLLTADPRLKEETECRLPSSFTECAITDFQAEVIAQKGILDSDTNSIKNINTLDEIIGMKLGELTITGIFQTEVSLEEWVQYDIPNYVDEYGYDTFEFQVSSGYSPASMMILKEGFAESMSKRTQLVMVKTSGSLSKDMALKNKLSDSTDGRYIKYLNYYYAFGNIVSSLNNPSVFTAVYLMLFLFVFLSFLASVNMFYGNIKSSEKRLGIMRSMGMSKSGVMAIVFLQGALIAFVTSLAALLVSLVTCWFMNKSIMLSLLSLSPLAILMVCVLSFASMFVVSFFSSRKAIRATTINVIEER